MSFILVCPNYLDMLDFHSALRRTPFLDQPRERGEDLFTAMDPAPEPGVGASRHPRAPGRPRGPGTHSGDSVSYTKGKRAFLETIRTAAGAEPGATTAPSPVATLRRRGGRVARRAQRLLLRVARMPRVGGWPRSNFRREDLGPRLDAAYVTLERILVEAVLPFWRSRVVDRSHGGYHLNHGPTGADLGPAPRHVITQTRTLWLFARLVRTRWGRPSDLQAARHGFEFLATRLWDHHHGGFAWRVLADGEPLSPHKHALAQAYALIALVEYWHAAQYPRALELARQTFKVWDAAAHDPTAGGYVEMHRHDWSPASGLQGYWAHDPAVKRLDTHLHIAEGFRAFDEVAGEGKLAPRLAELHRILTTADNRDPYGVTCFSRHWTPQPKRRVEYGFDVKRIVLSARLCGVHGDDPASHLALFGNLFANAIRRGWDRRDGGLFEAGIPARRAHELVKPWWAQAELLKASLLMWQVTGTREYAGVFLHTLDWVVRSQVDWNGGDWHANVDHRRRISGDKAWEWKGPYHVTRALLECREMLAALLYSAAT